MGHFIVSAPFGPKIETLSGFTFLDSYILQWLTEAKVAPRPKRSLRKVKLSDIARLKVHKEEVKKQLQRQATWMKTTWLGCSSR